MQFYLKTERDGQGEPTDEKTAAGVLKRLRYQGRKLMEVFVLHEDGLIDRYQERTRRKLGSNAVASRTWLCETAEDGNWVNGRYIPEPAEAIASSEPPATDVVLVLAGAEADPESTLAHLQELAVKS